MAELKETRLRLSRLSAGESHTFRSEPGAEARAELAQELGLSELRKLRFTGTLAPEGKADWRLTASLGATVVQPCGLTLAPVTTRIDEEITRLYAAHVPEPSETETEMPEDDTLEPLPETLDLDAVMAEALALALPAFPRAPDAELGATTAAPPGAQPLTDDTVKPFAALQALKDKMDGQ